LYFCTSKASKLTPEALQAERERADAAQQAAALLGGKKMCKYRHLYQGEKKVQILTPELQAERERADAAQQVSVFVLLY